MASVELIGAAHAEHTFEGIATRLLDMSPALRAEERVLEVQEQGVFAQHAGRFVDTGALKNSLTMPNAPGAVRKVSATSLQFGTSIKYARFQTEHIGPETEAGGMARPLPVAILKITEETRRVVAKDLMNHAVHGSGSELSLIEEML